MGRRRPGGRRAPRRADSGASTSATRRVEFAASRACAARRSSSPRATGPGRSWPRGPAAAIGVAGARQRQRRRGVGRGRGARRRHPVRGRARRAVARGLDVRGAPGRAHPRGDAGRRAHRGRPRRARDGRAATARTSAASSRTRRGRAGSIAAGRAAPTSTRACAWTRPRSCPATSRTLTRSWATSDNDGAHSFRRRSIERELTDRPHPDADRRGAAAHRVPHLVVAGPRPDRGGHLHPRRHHGLAGRDARAAPQPGHDARHPARSDRRQAPGRGRAGVAAGDRQDRRVDRGGDHRAGAGGDRPAGGGGGGRRHRAGLAAGQVEDGQPVRRDHDADRREGLRRRRGSTWRPPRCCGRRSASRSSRRSTTSIDSSARPTTARSCPSEERWS